MPIISSDLPDVTQLSDRILVMRQGRLIGELPKEMATEESRRFSRPTE